MQLNILMYAQRDGWSGSENPNSGLLQTLTPASMMGGKDAPTNRNSLTHTLVRDPVRPVHLHTRIMQPNQDLSVSDEIQFFPLSFPRVP